MSGRGVDEWLVELATGTPVASVVTDRVLKAARDHHALMVRWNRVHNLTRVVESEAVARLHWLDCLLAAERIQRHVGPTDRVLDVGSGAGFPGVCMASLWPQTEVTCLEPARKRVSFLQRVRAELKLDNLVVREGRVEDLDAQDDVWPGVTSRATFQPDQVGRLSERVASGGWLGTLVAEPPESWMADVQERGFQEACVLEYSLPGADHRAVLFARRD
jgi:16S rRNA (guanine527-N7)-methyltransferase